MDRALAVVFVLIAISGCASGGVSSPQPSEAPASSASTQSATTSTETPNDTVSFPPGTSENGIDNATRLLETHHVLLNASTFAERLTVDDVTEAADENGTFVGFDVQRVSKTTEKGANESVVTFSGENESQSRWFSEDTSAEKYADRSGGRNTTLYIYSESHPLRDGDTGAVRRALVRPWGFVVQPFLQSLEYEFTGTVVRENRTLYAFNSTGINESAREDHDELRSSVERADATVLVDQRGVVRSFDATTVHSRANETVTAITEYAVPETENVTATQPTWVTEELPHLEASLSDDRSVVSVNHTGGMTVSSAGLLVYSTNTTSNVDVPGTFEAGETLYLYRTQDDPERIRVSEGERPGVNDSFIPFEGSNVSVTASRNVIEGENRTRTTIEVNVYDRSSPRNQTSTTVSRNGSSRAVRRPT